MKVAVGGGRGFIGRAVCEALGGAAAPFGREGWQGPADALVWAGGRREADESSMDVQHVRAEDRKSVV